MNIFQRVLIEAERLKIEREKQRQAAILRRREAYHKHVSMIQETISEDELFYNDDNDFIGYVSTTDAAKIIGVPRQTLASLINRGRVFTVEMKKKNGRVQHYFDIESVHILKCNYETDDKQWFIL